MKINGTIFSKPQQDQLKRGIGAELNKVVAKVNDVDKRMLNYMGDWATGNEYHENDVVTWAHDGRLYEVIKVHTSSATFDPDNPEYYKAMTKKVYIHENFTNASSSTTITRLLDIIEKDKNAIIACVFSGQENYIRPIASNRIGGVVHGAYNSTTAIVEVPLVAGASLTATGIYGNSDGVTYKAQTTDIGVTGAYYTL